jgi:hypothetical protein
VVGLDTFDMYFPAHDHPQSIATVRSWFEAVGFVDVSVRYGPWPKAFGAPAR